MNHCISWYADIFFFPSLWRSRAVSSSEWTKTICCRFPAVTSRSVFITRSCFLWSSFATWQSWTGAVVSRTAVSDSTCVLLHACYCLSWGLEITLPFSFFSFFQKLLSLKVRFLNILSGKKTRDKKRRKKKKKVPENSLSQWFLCFHSKFWCTYLINVTRSQGNPWTKPSRLFINNLKVASMLLWIQSHQADQSTK